MRFSEGVKSFAQSQQQHGEIACQENAREHAHVNTGAWFLSEIYIHPQRRILIPSLTHGRFLLAGIYVTSTRSCYFRGSFLRLATRKLFSIFGMHVGVTDAREF